MALSRAIEMPDTVFILGAGFSYDAKVPLMGTFIDAMYGYAMRGSCETRTLSREEVLIFERFERVRHRLDGYHGRANFDSRNIEDILSILSFDTSTGSSSTRDIVEAIAKTIDLSCEVQCPKYTMVRGQVHFDERNDHVPASYQNFWRSLFKAMKVGGRKMPAFITFNYDLVLERSFVSSWVGREFGKSEVIPAPEVTFHYSYPLVPPQRLRFIGGTGSLGDPQTPSLVCIPDTADHPTGHVDIEILKLHGSLNFPRMANRSKHKNLPIKPFVEIVGDPYLLPPGI